jgi:hypothetical protein
MHSISPTPMMKTSVYRTGADEELSSQFHLPLAIPFASIVAVLYRRYRANRASATLPYTRIKIEDWKLYAEEISVLIHLGSNTFLSDIKKLLLCRNACTLMTGNQAINAKASRQQKVGIGRGLRSSISFPSCSSCSFS